MIINTTLNEVGDKFNWLEVKWFRFSANSAIIEYKCDVESDYFHRINMTKKIIRPRGRPGKNQPTVLERPMPLAVTKDAYNDFLPIAVLKKRDLLNLLRQKIIPSDYASIYENLPTSTLVKDCATWIQEEREEEERVDSV